MIFTFGRSLQAFHHTSKILKIENLAIPENTTLVTMDVTSLYTNILHDDGIAHAEKYGNKEQFKNLRQNA